MDPSELFQIEAERLDFCTHALTSHLLRSAFGKGVQTWERLLALAKDNYWKDTQPMSSQQSMFPVTGGINFLLLHENRYLSDSYGIQFKEVLGIF